MNTALYTKAFVTALIDHLRGNVPNFTEVEYGSGGCETCGWGATEYDVLQMTKLQEEINSFANNYKQPE